MASRNDRCIHGALFCSNCILVDDAAKNAYDAVRLLVTFTDYDTRVRQSPYIAIRLEDGFCDGVMYDRKRECVRHQSDERFFAYFCFRHAPNGFASAKEAAIYLAYHREAYRNGWRLPDPDAEFIMPDRNEQLFEHFRQFRS